MCLALPEATEKRAWGEPTFRVGKMFAMYAGGSHHGDGRDALWCQAPESAQLGLVEAAPDRFFIPPYVGKDGWIGIWLDAVDDIELELHIREAYRVVAPQNLVAQLEAEDGA